jgi:hypothetical protein
MREEHQVCRHVQLYLVYGCTLLVLHVLSVIDSNVVEVLAFRGIAPAGSRICFKGDERYALL